MSVVAGEGVTRTGVGGAEEKGPAHSPTPPSSTSLGKGESEEPDVGAAGLAWGHQAEVAPMSSASPPQWGQGPSCLSQSAG